TPLGIVANGADASFRTFRVSGADFSGVAVARNFTMLRKRTASRISVACSKAGSTIALEIRITRQTRGVVTSKVIDDANGGLKA
ncbi:hypothetical protein PMAYCL1PPCAC_27264, partial [Pristionchus mayeri]